MFLYLLLVTAIATSTDPLPTEAISPQEQEQLLEIIALLNQEDTPTVASEDSTVIETIAALPTEITITNGIEPSMLAYKHWTGTYSPETFSITVNGTEVAQGASYTLPAATKTMDIQYSYSFMNGMRTGAKKVSYELHENSTHVTITFSWKDTWKVLVDNGTAIKEEVL